MAETKGERYARKLLPMVNAAFQAGNKEVRVRWPRTITEDDKAYVVASLVASAYDVVPDTLDSAIIVKPTSPIALFEV